MATLEYKNKKITVTPVNEVTSATWRIRHPKEGQGFLYVTGTVPSFQELGRFLKYDRIFICKDGGVTIVYDLCTPPEEAVKSFLEYCLKFVV